MKNLKNLLPLFAIVLGVGLVFTQSAFKSAAKGKGTTMVYQYDQIDDSRLYDETAWNDVTSSSPESCSEGNKLPCVIQFDTDEFSDLTAYLAAHPTLQSIKNDADNLVSVKDGVIIEP